jgi:mRNA interferase RelE/StbE
MTYTVILPRPVQKQLAKLDATFASRIEDSLIALQAEPRPSGAKKLKGRDGWRMRVGDYRLSMRFMTACCKSSSSKLDTGAMCIEIPD